MVDVYQIIDNSAPCRRIICCRPPVSDNLPPIWRQRSQRLSSLHSAALCTADQQQRLRSVHCTEHFVALLHHSPKKQKSALYSVRRKMDSAPAPFHFRNWSKNINQNVFCGVLFMDTKKLSATYRSMPISRLCLSVLLRHIIHSAEECFDVHHRVQSHCNVAV